MSETLRIHFHDSGVQHVLSPPDHEALRVSVIGDTECLEPCGILLEGSPDNATWYTVGIVLEGSVNSDLPQPYLYLRIRGYGGGTSSINGTVVVEYLDTVPDDGTVTVANTPLEVEGQVETSLSTEALELSTMNEHLLKEILAELKKQTMLLEEMHS